jgi:hypothetical protein
MAIVTLAASACTQLQLPAGRLMHLMLRSAEVWWKLPASGRHGNR